MIVGHIQSSWKMPDLAIEKECLHKTVFRSLSNWFNDLIKKVKNQSLPVVQP